MFGKKKKEEYYEDEQYYESDEYDEDEYDEDEYDEDETYYEDEEYSDEEAYYEDGAYDEDVMYDEDAEYPEISEYDPNGAYYEDEEYDNEAVWEEAYDEEGEYLAEEEYYDETDEPEYFEEDDFLEEGDEYIEDEPFDPADPYYVYEDEPAPRRQHRREKKVLSREEENRRILALATGETKQKSLGGKIWGVVWRVLVAILVTLGIVLFFVFGALRLIFNGPSEAISTQYVSTFHETSALKWLPGLFMDQEKVDAILAKNMMPEAEEGTASNQDMIVIDETSKEDVEPISLEELFGTTYHGYMLTIQDPSRVYVGTVEHFAEGPGEIVPQFCERYGAVGGVNGGEFVDMGSYSYTAMPVGGVITRGEPVFENNAAGKWNLVCMTEDNKLILLKGYSVQAALNDYHVRDAVHVKHETGPFLIIDGEPLEVPDTDVYGGGKNPRTAIGQRADGAILMCVVDGRQASSLGATFKDMIDIMKEYGAVNAACLDGGTSTQMYYEGEIVNNPYSPTGPRRCPTAWLIDPAQGGEG